MPMCKLYTAASGYVDRYYHQCEVRRKLAGGSAQGLRLADAVPDTAAVAAAAVVVVGVAVVHTQQSAQ
jgi:hypothetical protein